MIVRHIPALLFALCPLLSSAFVYADEPNVSQEDPVTTIETKLNIKQDEIKTTSSEYDDEVAKLQQMKNEHERLKREGDALETKRNRAKSDLDKQYSRLLEDPDTDLVTFQKKYQSVWAELKKNQSDSLDNDQAMTETQMRLSQMKQKVARLKNEYDNLKEAKVQARIKRINSELLETEVLETHYKTTCSTTMTLGECSSQGIYLTKQKAVATFHDRIIDSLTESILAKQNLKNVELNISVKDSQILSRGFQGNNDYYTQIKAQLQARPEVTAGCKLLGVSTRYCLQGKKTYTPRKDKQWANVTIRSDQFQDSVKVDGVSYGSTPVEIVLPHGRHQFTVSKDGYETYNQVITINGNDTVWVKLRPNKES
ncbi:PEGA domain-containing protein [Vibrio quintilis]|uniref:PEGA domain protein n=1 Tax=Vibrio quintilis TaxID=1117707 RepID=A0A1M7YPL0_9VIBR|nr:PEGA domain-containing protein [Vibrio quintilis]SHO54544.1 PEGA domain protein [Vibrio quintilis]